MLKNEKPDFEDLRIWGSEDVKILELTDFDILHGVKSPRQSPCPPLKGEGMAGAWWIETCSLLPYFTGWKQRLDGDLTDWEKAVQTIGALEGTARNQLTLFKRLWAMKDAVQTCPGFELVFWSRIESANSPEGRFDGVFINDPIHGVITLVLRKAGVETACLYSHHPFGVLLVLLFLGALRS